MADMDRAADRLLEAAASQLSDDPHGERAALVAAVAGLLAAVAFSDRAYPPREEARVRAVLGRIDLLDEFAVDTLAETLRESFPDRLSDETVRGWAELLARRMDKRSRVELVEALLEIAASDGDLVEAERSWLLRLLPSLDLARTDVPELSQELASGVRPLF